MTPKERAEELLYKFNLPTGLMSIEIKRCALICVKEIITVLNDPELYQISLTELNDIRYWKEVEQEIEKL